MPALLQMRSVTVMRGDKVVLRDIDLEIGANENVAILGPNGCGKSTLIKTITRECYPLVREGTSINIFGRETWHLFDLRPLLGIVSNDWMQLCTRDISGHDAVLSGFFGSIGIWPHQRVTESMLEKTRQVLGELEIPHLADRPVDELSSGEARRILIARALVYDPRALVLDEPSSSLDLAAQLELRVVLRRLARSGIAIVMVTHHLADIIPEIRRVVLMRDGVIVADGAKEEILTEARLSELFGGVPVELARRDGYYHLW